MVGRLAGKVAIVTGASTGIGEGIAELFLKEGANTVICSRALVDIQKVADNIKSDSAEVMALQCDVTKSGEVENMVRRTIEKFGKLDILVKYWIFFLFGSGFFDGSVTAKGYAPFGGRTPRGRRYDDLLGIGHDDTEHFVI